MGKARDMSKTKLRVLILINPNASMAQAPLPAITSWFEERCNALIVVGKKKARAKELKEHGENMDLIVIGGGDGTISKALSALLKLKKPFAVLPLGTANDFARTIGVPADPLQAAQIALNGRQHRIDVGTVNDRPFVNVASVGVATKVAKAQSKTQKRRWRVWAYAISLLRAVRNLKPIFVHLEIDGKPTWSGQVYQVSVGNGRYHGGGLTVAEDAAIDDGKLHLYLIYPGRLWQLVASLAHLKFGLAKPDVLRQLKATTVTLNTDRPRPINADGELVTQTPGSFVVLPRALTVMVPADAPAQSPRLGKRE
jgi:diacylglycerol kinase (ATP)